MRSRRASVGLRARTGDDDPGAIVVGASRRALSVVRSLGRHGVATWLLANDDERIAGYSRYVSRHLPWCRSGLELVDELMALARAEGLIRWPLLVVDDDDAALCAQHHGRLSEHFRLSVPPEHGVAWALDKRRLYAQADDVELHHPRVWSSLEAALADPDLAYPIVVKPAFRPRHLVGVTPKAWRADDRASLEALHAHASSLMPLDRLMLQELIPGGGERQLAYGALCRDGEVLASIAACRRRQWPREFGSASTFVETIDEAELAPLARRLLAPARFSGLIELEFKRDPRDGRPALLDANPRPWGWISVGPRAGVDFSYLLWRMLADKPVPSVRGRPGVRWMRLTTDLPAAATDLRHGDLDLRGYLASVRPPLACSSFALDDPLPAIVDVPLLAGTQLRRRRRRPAEPSVGSTGSAPALSAETGRRPRVLIIVENAPVPGDRRVWHEALALRESGWSVTILAPHAWGQPPRPDDEVIDDVAVRRYVLRPAEASPLSYPHEYAVALWRIWREVGRLARPDHFDIIHACNPPDFLLLAALGQRRRGTRLVFDHHDLSPEMYESRLGRPSPVVVNALMAFERLGFALADVILATNTSMARVATTRGGQRAEDVFVVRNGPILHSFTPVAVDRTLARGHHHLLVYVGMMGPQDGLDFALDALSHLRQVREDWYALFLGDGEMLPSLREQAARLALDEKVEFAGFADDATVRRAICSADVCLAPDPRNAYTDRSTLVKLAEYMALSRPIVSFDLTESCVTAADAALYASDNDPVAFALAIDQLLGDVELRRTLGARGRARVERDLAWEHSSRNLLLAYGRALSGLRQWRSG